MDALTQAIMKRQGGGGNFFEQMAAKLEEKYGHLDGEDEEEDEEQGRGKGKKNLASRRITKLKKEGEK